MYVQAKSSVQFFTLLRQRRLSYDESLPLPDVPVCPKRLRSCGVEIHRNRFEIERASPRERETNQLTAASTPALAEEEEEEGTTASPDA
ncbi:hypothetical protein ACHAWF_015568 [Thalassiosira exigua]